MLSGEDLVERYLVLGLELGGHVDGFVDAYYGPPELAARVDSAQPADARRLVDDAASLAADIAADTAIDGQRKRWLQSQILGCETVARGDVRVRGAT